MVKIGNVEINGYLTLGPMAGVTDFAFRTVCKRLGAAMTTTEMVSAKALVYKDRKTKDLLYLSPEDTKNFINLLKVDFNTMHTIALNRKARGEYLALIQSYYSLHIPDFPEIKSMDVLRELFD